MSSLLTRVGGYRQTICSIADPDYLRHRLAGQGDPDVEAAANALKLLSENAATLIGKLDQDDFETLVGILLERQGDHRVSRLGGTLKDVDMAVEHSFTGERLFVQVKSKASQSVLNEYIQRFEASPGFARMIFAVHTPIGQLSAGDRPDIDIWNRQKLAAAAVRAGLVEWLMARAA